MARAARAVVQKAGVDVDKLRTLPVSNTSAELTTFYDYTILRVNLIGLEGEGLKEITEDARIEDRNHFEAWFSEFLGEGPSGRFRRQGTGFLRNSPFVSKFLIQ